MGFPNGFKIPSMERQNMTVNAIQASFSISIVNRKKNLKKLLMNGLGKFVQLKEILMKE